MNRVPNSLSEAVEACVRAAQKRDPRLSIERLADLCGETKWNIYKWMQTGSIPLAKLMTFEHACSAKYVTRYLCTGAHLLAVPMPSGRLPTAGDVQSVQEECTKAVAALLKFAAGQADVAQTEAALTQAMEQLAAERAQVQRSSQPEFDFGVAHE